MMSIFLAILLLTPFQQEADERKGQFLRPATTFDLDMVRTMRSMQEHVQVVSTRKESECLETLKTNGFQLVNKLITPDESGGRAYVAIYEKSLVIAFRGTKSAKSREFFSNLASDLDLRWKKMAWLPESYRQIKVHGGFASEYSRFRDAILKALDAHPEKEIYIVGHSLGSALATLAAFDIEVSRERSVYLYVSGTPRIAGKSFQKAFEKEVTFCVRMTVGDDPFPRIFPRTLGYVHVGWLLPLSKDGTVVPLDQIKAKMSAGTFGDHDNRLYRKVADSFLDRCRKDPSLFETPDLLQKSAKAERGSKR
ncbi:MAG: hypothetical protein QF645_05275 [Planctomycetota bacterium]|nr:hypothetical protein [Planctomycetota bacterium]